MDLEYTLQRIALQLKNKPCTLRQSRTRVSKDHENAL